MIVEEAEEDVHRTIMIIVQSKNPPVAAVIAPQWTFTMDRGTNIMTKETIIAMK